MINPDQPFRYVTPAQMGRPATAVNIMPLTWHILKYRLGITSDEAQELFEERRQAQHDRMPNLVGEYAIMGLHVTARHGRQHQFIDSIEAHRKELGLGEQVYGGYRAYNLVKHGVLFGEDNDEYAAPIYKSNKFHAAQVHNWREQVGFASNNPFDHMTRDEDPLKRGPVIIGFDLSKLQPGAIQSGERYKMHEGIQYWEPVGGMTIEETAQVVYHGAPLISTEGKIIRD